MALAQGLVGGGGLRGTGGDGGQAYYRWRIEGAVACGSPGPNGRGSWRAKDARPPAGGGRRGGRRPGLCGERPRGACRVLGQPRFRPALPCSCIGRRGGALEPRSWGWPRASVGTATGGSLPCRRAGGPASGPGVPCRQPKAGPSAAGLPLPGLAVPHLSVVHVWAYDLMAGRTHKRAALTAAGRGRTSAPGNPPCGRGGPASPGRQVCSPASQRLFDCPQVVSRAPGRRQRAQDSPTRPRRPGMAATGHPPAPSPSPAAPEKGTATPERASTASPGDRPHRPRDPTL